MNDFCLYTPPQSKLFFVFFAVVFFLFPKSMIFAHLCFVRLSEGGFTLHS